MGGGASTQARYMGGKSLVKFFREDTMPALVHLFEQLDMNEKFGFDIFKAFAKTDINEDGLVDIEECFKYTGGIRTKFTERIFYSEPFVDDDGQKHIGLTFKQFLIALWNYCTLDNKGLARYIFEIFDVDDEEMLERPDVVTMFKMLYDTDDFSDEYIAMFHFSEYTKISKVNFCDIAAKDRFLIQPAIDYQRKLKRKIGSKKMWQHLQQHRHTNLAEIEADFLTLAQSVDAIIDASFDYHVRQAQTTAAFKLQQTKNKIKDDAAAAEREYQQMQRRLEAEDRMLRSTAPDRKMHQAWSILLAKKRRFAEEEYLNIPKDLIRRKRDRDELFELYDIAKAESLAYWEYKDAKDIEFTEGTDKDHEARYQDHLKTDEGRIMLKIMAYIRLFELVLNGIKEQVSKMKRKPKTKSEKQAIFEAHLAELKNIIAHYREEGVDEFERTKRMRHMIERDFSDEEQFIKKWCKKPEVAEGEAIAHKELCAELKEQTMTKCHKDIDDAFEARRRDYIIKEFEIITNYGSRSTQWEYVLDKDENRHLYMNRETHEIRHPKTAICEQCDAIFVQHELRCDGCNAPRSAKNLKLFRPLGFKDITQE